MDRYTIWRSGMIMGTYEGETEEDALSAFVRTEGHKDFKAACKTTGLTRDDYKVKKVEG